MERFTATILAVLVTFFAGFFTHVLYQRWHLPAGETPESIATVQNAPFFEGGITQGYRVSFVPMPSVDEKNIDLPVLAARDVEKIRGLTGHHARVRGRVFRVGHSAKSNTYFLNFGPSREALSGVIFASTVGLFEKSKLAPKQFENKEVEITGQIKDHPQYGLEIILENPTQIKILE